MDWLRQTEAVPRRYFDHAATTPMVRQAIEAMTRELTRVATRRRCTALAVRPGGWSRKPGR